MFFLRAILALLAFGELYCISRETVQATLANLPNEALLNFTELSEKYRHPADTYYVTTEDRYILTLFNVPGDKTRPVLLCHGVFDTADGFLISGQQSLVITLAEAGYDVWVMNSRGNRYSRDHETLNPDTDAQYWDYSIHELGQYDLAACIDYVLTATGQKKLSIIGFSQGTTATFALAASQPSYNNKVNVFVALAPIVFLNNVRPMLSIIIQFSQFLNLILPPDLVEFVGYYSLTKALLNLICTQTVIGYDLCYQGGFNSLSGMNSYGVKKEIFPIIMAHFPAGASRKSLLHFAQISLRKSFAKYDYGASENFKRYFSFTPPEYDLSKVTMPVELVCGRNDAVSTLEDVATLRSKLPKVGFMEVNSSMFNHLDHLWAHDAYKKEYVYVLDKLKKYT